MVLEGVNGALCPIVAMHVGGDKLEGGIPLENDGFFVSRACFIIKDLEIYGETPGCQASHNSIVGGNAMAITLGLEGLLEDEVAVGVEGNHHILVAGASSDGEATGVISKELAEWLYHDEDLIGWRSNRSRPNHKWSRHRQLEFCRPDILALLGQMAHDCLV